MTNCGGVFYAGPHAESQRWIRYLQTRQLHPLLHLQLHLLLHLQLHLLLHLLL